MRRVPALVGFVVIAVLLVIVARTPAPTIVPIFAQVGPGWMPSAPDAADTRSRFWFCPGVPVDRERGVDGEILIGNRTAAPIDVVIEWLGVDTDPGAPEALTVAPFSTAVMSVGAQYESQFVAAVIEADGPAIIEQRIVHPAGLPVTTCSTQTSATWYLAEGYTVADSPNQLVLSNPFDDVAIVDIEFATFDGPRSLASYQGIPIAPRSVEVIDLATSGSGVQREDLLAVSVEATRGELVVGRAQEFLGGGRRGYAMTLAAPAARDQWWFADGEKGPGISSLFSVFNPSDAAVEVDVIFLGIVEVAEIEPLFIPAGEVAFVDPGQIETLPDGRYSVVFSTRAEPSIVVERVLTRTFDNLISTSVNMGAPPRPDGYVPARWHLVAVPSEPTPASMVVYNVDNIDGVFSLLSVGPNGPEIVPGWESRPLPAASLVVVDLPGGGEMIVESSTRIFVERSLPGAGGRSSSWAVPAEVDQR